jgi:CubicO group peptidase (beta-lactamase class C family)
MSFDLAGRGEEFRRRTRSAHGSQQWNFESFSDILAYKDQLIFAKSYGYVDVDNALFAEPDSRFRVASVSKAITAMGILKLVHDGQLSLNHQPFPFGSASSRTALE